MSAQIFDASFVSAKETRHCRRGRETGKGLKQPGKGQRAAHALPLCNRQRQWSPACLHLYIEARHSLGQPGHPGTQATSRHNTQVHPEGDGSERDGTCTCTGPGQIFYFLRGAASLTPQTKFFDKKNGIQLVNVCLLFGLSRPLLALFLKR